MTELTALDDIRQSDLTILVGKAKKLPSLLADSSLEELKGIQRGELYVLASSPKRPSKRIPWLPV